MKCGPHALYSLRVQISTRSSLSALFFLLFFVLSHSRPTVLARGTGQLSDQHSRLTQCLFFFASAFHSRASTHRYLRAQKRLESRRALQACCYMCEGARQPLYSSGVQIVSERSPQLPSRTVSRCRVSSKDQKKKKRKRKRKDKKDSNPNEQPQERNETELGYHYPRYEKSRY